MFTFLGSRQDKKGSELNCSKHYSISIFTEFILESNFERLFSLPLRHDFSEHSGDETATYT
jgi:hypothetical protein